MKKLKKYMYNMKKNLIFKRKVKNNNNKDNHNIKIFLKCNFLIIFHLIKFLKNKWIW